MELQKAQKAHKTQKALFNYGAQLALPRSNSGALNQKVSFVLFVLFVPFVASFRW